MKTIEERACEYVGGSCEADCALCHDICRKTNDRIAFIAGAEWMREQLARWHDPKEVLPEPYKVVEVKYRSSGMIRISTAWMVTSDAGGNDWTIDGTNRTINRAKVFGWREIHE